jgi:hypothetical protein
MLGLTLINLLGIKLNSNKSNMLNLIPTKIFAIIYTSCLTPT